MTCTQQSSKNIEFCRHQERGDTLFIENARLGQDLETQKLNLADINEFLTSELEASCKKLRQIEQKAAALQQQVDNIKETHTVCISHCCQLYLRNHHQYTYYGIKQSQRQSAASNTTSHNTL